MPAKKTNAAKAESTTPAPGPSASDVPDTSASPPAAGSDTGTAGAPASAGQATTEDSADGSADGSGDRVTTPPSGSTGPVSGTEAGSADPVLENSGAGSAVSDAAFSLPFPFPKFPVESTPPVEIPAAVPVVAPAVVDAIAAVPDDHRANYQQLIRSLAAVNNGIDNAVHALTALRALCHNDSGRELLVARQINAATVQRRLLHFLSEPAAEKGGH